MASSNSSPSDPAARAPLVTTALSSVDGTNAVLAYRGVPIEELAGQGFAAVGAFLVDDRWPDDGGASFSSRLMRRQLTSHATRAPTMTAAMASLRRSLSDDAAIDAAADDDDVVAFAGAAARLVGALRGRSGARADVVGSILQGVSDRAVDDDDVAALDAAFVVHLDHALNPGTLCVRVATSTGATLASCLTAGLCALEGPLHGGASSNVGAALERVSSPANVQAFVDAERAAKRRLPGFGHPIYRGRDPRSAILRALTQQVADARDDHRIVDVAVALEAAVAAQSDGRLFANVDFYAAALYASLGIPLWLHTPMFAAARMLGWASHVVEERARRKIISPEGGYDGPPPRSLHSVIAGPRADR